MQRKNSISVGVGRPVDDHWMSQFHHAFNKTAPAGMKFMRRREPGLLYVCGNELEESLDGRFSRYTREEVIRRRVRNLVGYLCVKQALPSAAAGAITVKGIYLERFETGRDGSHSEVALRVSDPNEGIVCDERDVVRHALLCQKIQGENNIYRIRLGEVNRPPLAVSQNFLDKVFNQLNESVRLYPVGTVLR